jgi:hypothetical protein
MREEERPSFLKKEAKNFFSCAFGALGLFGATAGTN